MRKNKIFKKRKRTKCIETQNKKISRDKNTKKTRQIKTYGRRYRCHK